jgi:predicted DNA-binding transcriptional regulator YafY
MRASRLLSFLLTLQTRGHMTAEQLAEELEVSVRTIYRDAEALLQAGIPLIASSGPEGGYRLDGGFRTRLTGMTESEARGIFLTGLSGPAAELGLGAALATAQLKLSAALPPSLSEQATVALERFHLDPVGWYATPDPVPHLAAVAQAVWEKRRVAMQYRRWAEPEQATRTVDPYGVVLKAGRWYLIASHDHQFRTYRVAEILEMDLLDQTFEREDNFDLPTHWKSYLNEFHDRLYRSRATIRISPVGRKLARTLLNGLIVEAIERSSSPADADGWLCTHVPIESIDRTAEEFLRLGAEMEVLEPQALRARLENTATRMTQMYQRPTSRGTVTPGR